MANVFSLDRTFKVVGTDGRISGEWVVILPPSGRAREAAWITPHNVVVYDVGLRSGVILGHHDLTAKVVDGVAVISRVVSNRRDDVEEVKDELLSLLVEIARVGADRTIRHEEGDR